MLDGYPGYLTCKDIQGLKGSSGHRAPKNQNVCLKCAVTPFVNSHLKTFSTLSGSKVETQYLDLPNTTGTSHHIKSCILQSMNAS